MKLSLADSMLLVNALFLQKYHFLTDFASKRTDASIAKSFYSTVNTVEPAVSDHPKCQAYVVAYGTWSLTRT